MRIRYEDDVAAWAEQQVALLRERRWGLLDVEHIAEEIGLTAPAEEPNHGAVASTRYL